MTLKTNFVMEDTHYCIIEILVYFYLNTEENHSNEHASYEIPPLTNIFESPIILSFDSLLTRPDTRLP